MEEKNLSEKPDDFSYAIKFLKGDTHEAEDYQEFKKVMREKRGFIKAFWCEDENCEKKIKVVENPLIAGILPRRIENECGEKRGTFYSDLEKTSWGRRRAYDRRSGSEIRALRRCCSLAS